MLAASFVRTISMHARLDQKKVTLFSSDKRSIYTTDKLQHLAAKSDNSVVHVRLPSKLQVGGYALYREFSRTGYICICIGGKCDYDSKQYPSVDHRWNPRCQYCRLGTRSFGSRCGGLIQYTSVAVKTVGPRCTRRLPGRQQTETWGMGLRRSRARYMLIS